MLSPDAALVKGPDGTLPPEFPGVPAFIHADDSATAMLLSVQSRPSPTTFVALSHVSAKLLIGTHKSFLECR
jgi:hypothetical protein